MPLPHTGEPPVSVSVALVVLVSVPVVSVASSLVSASVAVASSVASPLACPAPSGGHSAGISANDATQPLCSASHTLQYGRAGSSSAQLRSRSRRPQWSSLAIRQAASPSSASTTAPAARVGFKTGLP